MNDLIFVVLTLRDNRLIRGEVSEGALTDPCHPDVPYWLAVRDEHGRTLHVNTSHVLFWHRAVPS